MPTKGKQFFECPCFDNHPLAANNREQQLAGNYYEQMRMDLRRRGICPNRGMVIALKVAAIMARNIDPQDRAWVEPQLHEFFDHELAHNPSE